MNRAMSRHLVAAAAVLGLWGAAGAAHAGNVSWSVGISAPLPGAAVTTVVSGGPTYYRPAPVYMAPQPVYVEPQPVYVEPEPVYVQPAPVYVPRRVVYVQPAPVVVGAPVYVEGHHHHHHHHHDHDWD